MEIISPKNLINELSFSNVIPDRLSGFVKSIICQQKVKVSRRYWRYSNLTGWLSMVKYGEKSDSFFQALQFSYVTKDSIFVRSLLFSLDDYYFLLLIESFPSFRTFNDEIFNIWDYSISSPAPKKYYLKLDSVEMVDVIKNPENFLFGK
jgi:hypothetical protein